MRLLFLILLFIGCNSDEVEQAISESTTDPTQTERCEMSSIWKLDETSQDYTFDFTIWIVTGKQKD